MPEEPIEVTCEACNHSIKAPRKAAGRRGKCPHCGNSVYVPTPPEDREEIPLAPHDEEQDAKAEALEHEAFELAASLRREGKDRSEKSSEPEPESRSKKEKSKGSRTRPSGTDLANAIVAYLQAMESSDLENADRIAEQLKRSGRQARSKVQQFMVDTMRPEPVKQIPEGLYRGFLSKLLQQLGG